MWMGAGTTCAGGACDEPDCPTDVNGDGSTNVTDILSMIADWGACSGCDTDVNNDGNVNVTDLLQAIAAWGACE